MDINPSIISLERSIYQAHFVNVDMLRLDTIHPQVSGNKYFKLFRHHEVAIEMGADALITFGGAYSNHLHATAYYGKMNGIKTIGLVRGEEHHIDSNTTLKDCHDWGMELHFISRSAYQEKNEGLLFQSLVKKYKALYIPEGGASAMGVAGAATISRYIPDIYDYVIVSVGSGTTIAGLVNGLSSHNFLEEIIGFVPMKSGTYLIKDIASYLPEHYPTLTLVDEYHFGGFGKCNQELIDYIILFHKETQVLLDVVYTAKMMYGMDDLIRKKIIPHGSKILTIHTGGVQGNRSHPSLNSLIE